MTGHNFILLYEKFALEKLAKYLQVDPAQILHLTVNNPISPYDLEHQGIKYDVKMSHPVSVSQKKKMLVWDFDLRGTSWENGRNKKLTVKKTSADFYLLIGVKNGIPSRIFLIPIASVPSSHVRISIRGISKYYQYEI